MSGNEVRIRIEDNDDLLAARAAAASNGVAIQEMTAPPSGGLEQQIEPVTAVLIGAGVVAGVKMVMDWWDRRKGGLVVDLRTDAPDMFYRDKDISYGYVVTRPAEGGTVTVDVKDKPDAAEKWVSEVIAGAYKTVTQVAEAAKASVGAERVATSTA